MTITTNKPMGTCIRWKLVYKSSDRYVDPIKDDTFPFTILMIDHSQKLKEGTIKRLPTNNTYCISSFQHEVFVRSDDFQELKDIIGHLFFRNTLY